MSGAVLLHGVTGAPATPLAGLLGQGLEPIGTYRPLVATPPRAVMRVSGPQALLDEAGGGVPAGAARPEAVTVRLRRAGVEARWGPPDVIESLGALREWCRQRGRSSVEISRADPSLVAEMEVGAWFHAGWRGRLLRRTADRLPGGRAVLDRVLGSPALALQVSCDLAFWAGVHSAASPAEWRRLTQSSYAMLVYHRLAGEGKPGQERIDIDPRRFRLQVSLLRLLGFRQLPAETILAFHSGAVEWLPARSFAVTLDDGFLDCHAPLLDERSLRPQLFVCTEELGGTAHWADGEPVMSWEHVVELASHGTAIGAHGRRHEVLVGLDDDALAGAVQGSLDDLRKGMREPLQVLAYPHGAHDERVRDAARAAGFQAAYTTQRGKNGAGTDPYCLRRISVHACDGPLTILWKALTGEPAPRRTQRG